MAGGKILHLLSKIKYLYMHALKTYINLGTLFMYLKQDGWGSFKQELIFCTLVHGYHYF